MVYWIRLFPKSTLTLATLLLIFSSNPSKARNDSQNREASQIEFSGLLKMFMFPRTASYNILPWMSGSSANSPIEWNHAGIVECDPATEKQYNQIFCRSGSVAITVNGKITHTVLGKRVQAGRWNIQLMGPHAGAYLVKIESDINSGELSPTFLVDALKGNKANRLSVKSIKKCAEGNSEMFIISEDNFKHVSAMQSWSCGSGGCSIQLLLGGDDASKAGTCSSSDLLAGENRRTANEPNKIDGSFVGRWFSNDASVCKGSSGETEGLIVYSSTEAWGYENFCKITKAIPKGSKTALTMRCSSEGMTSTEQETVEVAEGKLRRTISVRGKRMTFTHSRCPPDLKLVGAESGISNSRAQPATTTPPAVQNATEPGLVEPDRPFGAVGDWKVSTARYGIGCVAVYSYDNVHRISIGGEATDRLAMVVEADRKLFEGSLDAEPYVQGVEVVLGTWRKGNLRPYGYRGTPGVVAIFDSNLSQAFLETSSLKLTERGSVKLDVFIRQSKQMMAKLTDCFLKAQPPADVAKAANQPSDVKPPSSSDGLPKRAGQCVDTSISAITDRFGQTISPSPSKDGFDPGTAIKYANGGFQISYDKEAAIIRSTIGDKVRMCLLEIPKDCPPGDDRGRIYNTKNLRTGEAWTLADAQHRCGGA